MTSTGADDSFAKMFEMAIRSDKEEPDVPAKCVKCGSSNTITLGNGRMCHACKVVYWRNKGGE